MQLQLDELPTAIGESRTSEPSSAVAATHFLVLKDDSKYINDSIVSLKHAGFTGRQILQSLRHK